MLSQTSNESVLTAANELVAHLRAYPEAAEKKPSVLADQFNLDEAFVASVLQNIRSSPRYESARQDRGPGMWHSFWDFVRHLWLGATSKPLLFVIVTFVLCLSLGIISSQFDNGPDSQRQIVVGAGMSQDTPGTVQGSVGASGVYIALAILVTLVLHMSVYYRHRGSRNAVYGGLFLWGALTLLIAVLQISRHEDAPLLGIVFGSLGMFMLALMYTGAGALASIVGGYFYIQNMDRKEEQMTRQDLLERYFELQERLQTTAYPRPGDTSSFLSGSPFIQAYRKNPYLPNLIFGAAVSFLQYLGSAVAGIDPNSVGTQLSVWLFGLLLIGLSTVLYYIFQGFLARDPLRVLTGVLAIYAGEWAVRLLILAVDIIGSRVGFRIHISADYNLKHFSNIDTWIGDLTSLAFLTALSYAGYLGARVQSRALLEHNLATNDQATLLGEMVRIQWRLSNEAGRVCIMVVDAARSSEMKSDADPFLVEYTFREYQEWIANISVPLGGRIHSTAGDGAVVAFSTCDSALAAAKRLQTDIYRFNKDDNRLQRPFRLRIGLHAGEVAGDVGKVQFTEVIDIAAHMESVSPIGGIVVSDTVAEHLIDENLIDLNRTLDGHRVLMIANPSE